jgi:hypothetical protein
MNTSSQPQGREGAGGRVTGDRRKKPTNPFSWRAFKGRRQAIRRKEDRRHSPYVDQYNPRVLLLVVPILLLGVADGLLTISHVSAGARELNPLMEYLLYKGPYIFFTVKYALFALSVLILVVYWHHPVVRTIMVALTVVYGAVFLNHIYLFLS